MIFTIKHTIEDTEKGNNILEWDIDDEVKYSKQPETFRAIADTLRQGDNALFDNCIVTFINEFDRIIITYNHE